MNRRVKIVLSVIAGASAIIVVLLCIVLYAFWTGYVQIYHEVRGPAQASIMEGFAPPRQDVSRPRPRKKSLDKHIEEALGPGTPINCGPMKVEPSEEEVQKSFKCVSEAILMKKMFFFVAFQHSIDSEAARGILAKADGPTMVFQYDSAPCGNEWGCLERFEKILCFNPVVTENSWTFQLDCSLPHDTRKIS